VSHRCNFKRFNAILNSEILLNLGRKIKYLKDQFQLRFCFCIGNTIGILAEMNTSGVQDADFGV